MNTKNKVAAKKDVRLMKLEYLNENIDGAGN